VSAAASFARRRGGFTIGVLLIEGFSPPVVVALAF
jgi:hypothetical protein